MNYNLHITTPNNHKNISNEITSSKASSSLPSEHIKAVQETAHTTLQRINMPPGTIDPKQLFKTTNVSNQTSQTGLDVKDGNLEKTVSPEKNDGYEAILSYLKQVDETLATEGLTPHKEAVSQKDIKPVTQDFNLLSFAHQLNLKTQALKRQLGSSAENFFSLGEGKGEPISAKNLVERKMQEFFYYMAVEFDKLNPSEGSSFSQKITQLVFNK